MKLLRKKRLMQAFAALATLACIGSANATGDGVKFGVLVPLTGTNSVQGRDILHGIQLAVARINAGYDVPMKGGKSEKVGPGLLGGKIKLITEDDESRPQSAMASVHKLVNVNHVSIVLGMNSSGIATVTGQFTNSAKIVELPAVTSSPNLRNIGPYFFDTIGLDTLVSNALAKFVAQDSGAKTFGVIAPNNPYGAGIEVNFCEDIKKLGGKCINKIYYQQGKSDYRPEIRAAIRRDPDAVVFTGYGTDAILILRESFQMGISRKNWYSPYLTLWSGNIKKNSEIADGIKGLIAGKATEFYKKQFVDGYEKMFNAEINTVYSAYAYDSAMLAALAVKKAGSAEPDAIRKALPKVAQNYAGVTGDKRFDKDGMQKTENYTRKIIYNGKLHDYPIANDMKK